MLRSNRACFEFISPMKIILCVQNTSKQINYMIETKCMHCGVSCSCCCCWFKWFRWKINVEGIALHTSNECVLMYYEDHYLNTKNSGKHIHSWRKEQVYTEKRVIALWLIVWFNTFWYIYISGCKYLVYSSDKKWLLDLQSLYILHEQ